MEKHRGNGVAVTEWQAHGNLRTQSLPAFSRTVKNARMALTALTGLKSIKAAGNSAIFFQDGLKTYRLGPRSGLAPEGGIDFPALPLTHSGARSLSQLPT